MAFPTSPANGAQTIVNGIGYVYSSSTNSWTRAISPVGNLTVSGNVFSDRLYTTTGLYWAGNNQAFTGTNGISFTSSITSPAFAELGDQWYATDIGVLFEYLSDGDSSQWIDISTPSISTNSAMTLSAGDLSVLGAVTPGIDTTYDLGNLSYRWRDAYLTGVITTGNIISSYGLFWANGTPAVYSNTSVANYLPVHAGNVSAGNVSTGNVSASFANIGKVTSTQGYFWANGTPAVYSDTLVASYLPTHTGNIAASYANIGKVTSTQGYFWANGVNILSSTFGNTEVGAYIPTFTGTINPSLINSSGNLTVAGNLIQQSAYYERFGNLTNSGGNLTCDFTNGTIFNVTSLTNNVTANFINVNALPFGATGAVIVINQGVTIYKINNVQINGTQIPVRWVSGNGSGISPVGVAASNTDVISFSMMYLGGDSYMVLGQLSTFG